MSDADTKEWMDEFKAMMKRDDDEQEAVKKTISDQLSIDEALDITFAAFDYFIRQNYDGGIEYVDSAQVYGRQVCAKACEFKAKFKDRFHVAAVVAAFDKLWPKKAFLFKRIIK